MLGAIENVSLHVSDQFEGGCWTSVSAVKSRILAKLERAGIGVYHEDFFVYGLRSPRLNVTFVGYRAKD